MAIESRKMSQADTEELKSPFVDARSTINEIIKKQDAMKKAQRAKELLTGSQGQQSQSSLG